MGSGGIRHAVPYQRLLGGAVYTHLLRNSIRILTRVKSKNVFYRLRKQPIRYVNPRQPGRLALWVIPQVALEGEGPIIVAIEAELRRAPQR
jgi:hypothetical protein